MKGLVLKRSKRIYVLPRNKIAFSATLRLCFCSCVLREARGILTLARAGAPKIKLYGAGGCLLSLTIMAAAVVREAKGFQPGYVEPAHEKGKISHGIDSRLLSSPQTLAL